MKHNKTVGCRILTNNDEYWLRMMNTVHIFRLDTQSPNDGRSAHLGSNRRRSHSPGHCLTSDMCQAGPTWVLWHDVPAASSNLFVQLSNLWNLWNLWSNTRKKLSHRVASWSASIGSSNPGSGATFEFGPFLLPQKPTAHKKTFDLQGKRMLLWNIGEQRYECV